MTSQNLISSPKHKKRRKKQKKVNFKKKIGFIFSIVGAASGLITFLFSEFTTKEIFKTNQEEVNQRLSRVERKVDNLLMGIKND